MSDEKLYTVEIPNPHSPFKFTGLYRGKYHRIVLGIGEDRDELTKQYCHLTEEEIKKDFEWAWNAGFAKPVYRE